MYVKTQLGYLVNLDHIGHIHLLDIAQDDQPEKVDPGDPVFHECNVYASLPGEKIEVGEKWDIQVERVLATGSRKICIANLEMILTGLAERRGLVRLPEFHDCEMDDDAATTTDEARIHIDRVAAWIRQEGGDRAWQDDARFVGALHAIHQDLQKLFTPAEVQGPGSTIPHRKDRK